MKPPSQIVRFADGSFCLHKIQIEGRKTRISAWFNKDGTLLDAEWPASGKAVSRTSPTWAKVQQIGKSYV